MSNVNNEIFFEGYISKYFAQKILIQEVTVLSYIY
jgi:hypothetical protein